MDRTASFYSQPSYQFKGAGFPVYAGSRRQRGGSILGALSKMVLPVLSTVGKNVGRAALNQAMGFAKDVMGDIARGGDIKQSLKQHGLKRLRNVALKSLSKVSASRKRQTSEIPKRHQPLRKKRKQTQPKALF